MKVSLKAARVNAELTQRQAAQGLGVDVTTIINWENGRTSPKYIQLEELCKLYDIPVDCVFLGKKSS